jgi:RsiW-degrading membrane proteinase PrsW (M82 family)
MKDNVINKNIKSKIISKRIMQLILGLISILALYTAYLGYAYGAVNWYYGFADVQEYSKGLLMLESNFRFYNGLWLDIGIVLLWLIPRVEREKTTLRVIAVCFFCGGIGRLISLLFCGIPSPIDLVYVIIELGFPLLTLWQKRILE